MSRLMEYFNEVDKNAVMFAAHQMDPAASMARFGLNAGEQEAVVSGDYTRLAGAVGIALDKSAQLQVLVVPQTIAIAD